MSENADYFAIRDRVDTCFRAKDQRTKTAMAAWFAAAVGARLMLDLGSVLAGKGGNAADAALLNALRDVETRFCR